MSALSQAESRFDSDICRVLIKDGGADPSELDHSGRSVRTPRSLTTEMIPTSPRLSSRKKHTRSRSTEQLSPLVVPSRMSRSPDSFPGDLTPRFLGETPRLDSGISLKKAHSFDSMSTTDCDSECSLPDVQEVEEEDDGDSGMYTRKRRNSLSLPDLRDTGMLSISPRISPRLGGEDKFPRHIPRYERSLTLDDRTSPLPQLSEEEEPPMSPPANSSNLSRRRGSVSLPDLRDCKNCLVGMNNNIGGYEGDSTEDSEHETEVSDNIPNDIHHNNKENNHPRLHRPKQTNITFPSLLSSRKVDDGQRKGKSGIGRTIVRGEGSSRKAASRIKEKPPKLSSSLQVGGEQLTSPRKAEAVTNSS